MTTVALDESTDDERGTNMILATTMVEDADRFLEVFGTKGAEKRAEHGSQVEHALAEDDAEGRLALVQEADQFQGGMVGGMGDSGRKVRRRRPPGRRRAMIREH